LHLCARTWQGPSVAVPDPGSGAFLPPGSGIRIRDEFFRIPDQEGTGMFFGENFLNSRIRDPGRKLLGSGIRDDKFRDPGSG
jgi:hypothetical protein